MTPEDVEARGATAKGKRQVGIENEAKNWATPNAHDGRRPGSDETSTQGANLKRSAESWATPSARDWKDGANPSESVETNSLLGRQAPRWGTPRSNRRGNELAANYDRGKGAIEEQAGALGSHLAQATSTAGDDTSPKVALNPQFVEVLMDFPLGWTTVPTDSGV